MPNIKKKRKIYAQQREAFICDYFAGPKFQDRLQTIMGSLQKIKQDLDEEKEEAKRVWNYREKQMEKIVLDMAMLQGEVNSIANVRY